MKYKVCVICYTYNQSKYIEDALDGFCIQNMDNPYICTIIDDCSSDGEQRIIQSYFESNFNSENDFHFSEDKELYSLCFAQHKTNKNCFFCVVYLKRNLYQINENHKKREIIKQWTENSKYIAFCEGDDYWTSESKLQKQVTILDTDSNVGLVYAKAIRFDQSTQKYGDLWGSNEDYKELLLKPSFIPTLSVCIRQSILESYYGSVRINSGWPLGDVPIWLYCYKYSRVFFLDETIGVYRIVENSASHNPDFRKQLSFFDGAYRCRAFYAGKYWGKSVRKEVEICRISRIAYECRVNNAITHIPLIPSLIKAKIINPVLWLRCILVSTPLVYLINKIKR